MAAVKAIREREFLPTRRSSPIYFVFLSTIFIEDDVPGEVLWFPVLAGQMVVAASGQAT